MADLATMHTIPNGANRESALSIRGREDACTEDTLGDLLLRRPGTHFHTADEAERANTIAHLGSTYAFEGVAQYLAFRVRSTSEGRNPAVRFEVDDTASAPNSPAGRTADSATWTYRAGGSS